MAHPATALFALLGSRPRALEAKRETQVSDDPNALGSAEQNAKRIRLPPPDESFYWAWQYWSK
ncbi:hypothetical protein [Neomesorhizobium albiziae]|uniref:hypothetical protein n=1 Tax=Neomesorhizobium albiziae TaxID=335020 RepID=UPI00122C5167|nr:hypothetical protein [Mesorhizobium albiziae]